MWARSQSALTCIAHAVHPSSQGGYSAWPTDPATAMQQAAERLRSRMRTHAGTNASDAAAAATDGGADCAARTLDARTLVEAAQVLLSALPRQQSLGSDSRRHGEKLASGGSTHLKQTLGQAQSMLRKVRLVLCLLPRLLIFE